MGTSNFARVFGARKPVIAMVHLGALPGAPLHDFAGGLAAIIDGARNDLRALQAAGFDAVMFGNENDRPDELKVDTASSAAMAYVIGRLADELRSPFGVNVLWDPNATLAVAAATGAAMRYRNRLGRSDLAMLYNVSAEFAHSLDTRSVAERARSAVFSSIPDAVLVSGVITGEAAAMEDLESVKRALPKTPVLANTGVKHATIGDVLRVADGCIVGSALKVDGDTWKPVDPERAAEFMRLARSARGE